MPSLPAEEPWKRPFQASSQNWLAPPWLMVMEASTRRGPGRNQGPRGVFLHAAVERVVADRQQVGLDTQQAAVGQPELAAVQRKGGGARGVAVAQAGVRRPGSAQGEDVEAADDHPPVARAVGGVAAWQVDVQLSARGAFEAPLQRLGLGLAEVEGWRPLAQGAGHVEARPVEHAVIAGRQRAGGNGAATLGPVDGGAPQRAALFGDQLQCLGVAADRGAAVGGAQALGEGRFEAVEAGALDDALGQRRLVMGDDVGAAERQRRVEPALLVGQRCLAVPGAGDAGRLAGAGEVAVGGPAGAGQQGCRDGQGEEGVSACVTGVAHRVDSCSCSVHGSIGAAGGARASGARRRRGPGPTQGASRVAAVADGRAVLGGACRR